jgi:hypothetical protein
MVVNSGPGVSSYYKFSARVGCIHRPVNLLYLQKEVKRENSADKVYESVLLLAILTLTPNPT